MDYQQFLSTITEALLSILASVIIGVIFGIAKRVTGWLDSHTSANQRSLLHALAGEAVAYAKTAFPEHTGAAKLGVALGYVNARLKPIGVTITEQELRGTIEKAYFEQKAKLSQVKDKNDDPNAGPLAEAPSMVIPPALKQLIDAAVSFVASQQQPQAAATKDEIQASPGTTQTNA